VQVTNTSDSHKHVAQMLQSVQQMCKEGKDTLHSTCTWSGSSRKDFSEGFSCGACMNLCDLEWSKKSTEQGDEL
jgi:hypothetical protein